MNYNALLFCEKKDLKSFFRPILLSKPNMGINYIDKVLEHKNPLYSIRFFNFLRCGKPCKFRQNSLFFAEEIHFARFFQGLHSI